MVVLVAAPIRPGYIRRYVFWADAIELMNTITNVITNNTSMIISVRLLRDVFIPSAFFRNVGLGRFIKDQNNPVITPLLSISISIAAGCGGRPGIVTIVPVRITR